MTMLQWTLRNGGNGNELHTNTISGKTEMEFDLVQCCHCQLTFKHIPGSQTRRGLCFLCGKNGRTGQTCGKPWCDTHYYKEQQIDDLEAVARKNKASIEAAVRIQAQRERLWNWRSVGPNKVI